MNRRNMLTASVSALAGFFMGGKLPQSAASDLDIDTIKRAAGTLADEREYILYTIPNCGKIPDATIVGDPVLMPRPTLASANRILKDAANQNSEIAHDAGRLIAEALRFPVQQEIVARTSLEVAPVTFDSTIDYKEHKFNCSIAHSALKNERWDVFAHLMNAFVDYIVEQLNKQPHKYITCFVVLEYNPKWYEMNRLHMTATVETRDRYA